VGICLPFDALCCQSWHYRDPRTAAWNVSNHHYSFVSPHPAGHIATQLTISSCLTGLPIQGAILNSQKDAKFSGLQLFAAISIIIGTGLTAGSRFVLAKIHKSKMV